jgi:hypothetical protein
MAWTAISSNYRRSALDHCELQGRPALEKISRSRARHEERRLKARSQRLISKKRFRTRRAAQVQVRVWSLSGKKKTRKEVAAIARGCSAAGAASDSAHSGSAGCDTEQQGL